MADIRVNLRVSSDGTTATETRQAAALANELERGTRAATAQARIRQASPVSSGSTANTGGNDETTGYRQFRGASGTGAEARDFSKQAAGLGGLVHVYATFAANIFALSAAFTALSKAADTTNMVRGLDQLGAASGRNLGNLSKDLIKVSDSTISLKDALTATAQAASGGLTGDQLLRITAVARNASQALGRDMPDALSRLTRGITKIEPELLDELGILVKVDTANINYARSIGKTATSLTDLEKRQAFANEAISQGEKKFKDIDLVANPYQKILASVTNLTQSGLELVNKVLGPMINLLASSPTALSATLAGIAGILLKQAIPALGQWRASLNEAAATARESAQAINTSFTQFQDDIFTRNAARVSERISSQRTEAERSVNNLNRLAVNGVRTLQSEVGRILTTSVQNITDDQVQRIQREEEKFRRIAANSTAQATQLQSVSASPEQISRAQRTAELYTAQADNLRQYREELPRARQAVQAFAAAQVEADREFERIEAAQRSRFSESSQRQRIADRANREAAKAEILSNVGQNTQIMGVRGAFVALRNDIRNGREAVEQIGQVGQAGYQAAIAARRPLEGLAATATLVRGSFTIATSAIGTFLNAFGPWAAIITLAITAISALIDYMSTNTKQVTEFKDSIESLASSTELMGNTIDAINKKTFLEQLSVESIQARSTAIEGLSNSINKTITTLLKADASASGFDKFLDGWKTLWGGDLRTIATKGLSKAISQSLISATDGEAKAKLLSSIQGILGTTDTSAEGITTALDNLTKDEVTTKLQELAKASQDFSTATSGSSNALVSFSSAIDETNKQVGLLTVGLTLTDPMSKVGSSIVALSNSIKNALDKGPINSLSILNKLINEPGKATFLPPEIFNRLLSMKTNVDAVSLSIAGSSKAVDTYRKELAKLEDQQAKSQDSKPSAFKDVKNAQDVQNASAIESTKAALEVAENSLKIAREKEKALALELADVNKSVFDYGSKVISLGLKNASESAALSISKAALAGISGRGAAEVQYNLQVQEIEIQKQIVQGELNLAQALFLNTQALEKINAKQSLGILEGKLQATGLTEQDRKVLETQKDNILKTIDVIDKTVGIIKEAKNSPKSLMNAAKEAEPSVSQSVLAYAAPLQGGFAKIIGLQAQETIAKNTEIIGQLKEQSTYRIEQNNLKLKDLDLDSKTLENAKQYNLISEDYYVKQNTRLALEKQQLDNSSEMIKLQGDLKVLQTQLAQGDATNSAASQAVADKKAEIVRAEGRALEANNLIIQTGTDRLKEQLLTRQEALAKAQVEANVTYGQVTPEKGQQDIAAIERATLVRKNASQEEIAAFDIKQKATEYTQQYTIATRELGYEIEKTNKLQTKATSLADQLAKSFGRVGTALGLVAKATTKSASDRLAVEQKLLEDKNKLDQRYGKGSEKAISEGVKLEKEAATEKAGINLNMYADIAGAAADSFDQQSGAAKAFHAIEKVLHLAKLAMDIESIVSSITVAGIQETLASTVALSWIPAVWARAFGEGGPYLGWALGAAAIAMIGLAGSSGGKGPSGPSSKDLEKVQGTGQKYDSQGKLVSTGYGVLGDDTAKSASIANSIERVANYTYEQLDFSNKMLSTLKAIRDSLGNVTKNIVLTSGLTSGTAFNTKEGTSGGGILSSIFGGKTSTEIIGSGLNIKGSVSDLAMAKGIIEQYETIQKTKSGGWFSHGSTSVNTQTNALSGDIVSSIQTVFSNLKDSLVSVGSQLGLSAEDLNTSISKIPINLSIELRNLSGSELSDAVSAVLSSTFDEITEKALSIVKPFQQVGEGLAETAVRVANDSRVIDLQLQSVGMVFNSIGLGSLSLRENLITLSGGLDEFVSKSDFFKENFLTAAQQLAPVQKAVTDELNRLGLSAIDSRQKFADLVLGLDLSKKSDQELYVSLMNLEKGFATVYDAVDDTSLSIKDLASSLNNQLIKILDLSGDKLASTNLSRQLELKTMDKRLVANQVWIYALEDEATARDDLATAYSTESQARQTSIDSLKQSRDSLLTYAKTLALGTTSPLTPEQKYEQAKSDLAGITQVINDSVSSKEDKAAAVNKLPDAISNFLETSKVFNASSEAFQQDYAYSQKLLLDNSNKLTDQISVEQKQLDALTSQVKALGVISDNTLTISQGIANLYSAITNTNIAKGNADKNQDFGNYSFVQSSFEKSGTSLNSASKEYFANLLNTGAQTRDQFTAELDNVSLVTSWYKKVLNRQPDLEGLLYWVKWLDDKSQPLSQIKSWFAYGAAKESGASTIPDINAFAKGGLASGLSLVGEKGPELVDFANPGRVYSNNQSESLFSEFGSNIAQEVRALREEVTKLRLENQEIASNNMQSNAICSENVATTIAGAITDTASRSEFNQRNKPDFE